MSEKSKLRVSAPSDKKRLERIFAAASNLLAQAGVWRIDPTLRDCCKLWASTRENVTAHQVAAKYLAELQESLKPADSGNGSA